MSEKRPFSPLKALWKLICLFLGLVLLLMLAVTAGFRCLTEQIRFPSPNVPQEPVLSAPAAPSEAVLEFLDPTDVNWTQLTADLTKPDRDVLNILLIGQDRREGDTTARSDSILLCSFRSNLRLNINLHLFCGSVLLHNLKSFTNGQGRGVCRNFRFLIFILQEKSKPPFSKRELCAIID